MSTDAERAAQRAAWRQALAAAAKAQRQRRGRRPKAALRARAGMTRITGRAASPDQLND